MSQFLQTEHAPHFGDYFKFTFVRNPYDRLYSGYLQDRYAAEHYPRWRAVKKPIFDEIGDDFPAYFRDHVLHANVLSDWQWICFTPMAAFACRDGVPAMDFVGRAETFALDLEALGQQLRLDIQKSEDQNVRVRLCESKPKYLDRFDRATVEAINERYRQDFELFNYEMLDPRSFPSRLR